MFRGVDFRLSRIEAKEDLVLKGIPHFRFSERPLEKCFDLSQYWLLECVEKGRVVSEATARLLLSSMIQNARRTEMVLFVRVGEVEISEKFIGFRKADECEYFETFVEHRDETQNENESDFEGTSAQMILKWFPGNLRVNYPGFMGHFDSRHPIERIQVRCIWPRIPREGIKFKREELIAAPIWVVSNEQVEESEMLPLRNSMLRSIQAAHLREVLFTSMGRVALISIPVKIREGSNINSLRALYNAIALAYRTETERLENDVTSRFNFIPKRVSETMRWERLNEAFSLIWRRFVQAVEGAWNDLCILDLDIEACDDNEQECGDIENGLKLVNWCIEREIEWQSALKDHALLRKLYRIPPRHVYNELSVDDKIEAMRGKLGAGLEELKLALNEQDDEEIFEDVITEDEDEQEQEEAKRSFEHGFDLGTYIIYEPVILNCEPPPNKLMTRSLLKNPLAGEVIAMNQLREDMRVFRAWNEHVCGVKCKVDEVSGDVDVNGIGDFNLGFIGFLLWHSPNDIEQQEQDEGGFKVSQRMRDVEGQWLKLWHEQSPGDVRLTSLNQQVSFNHRAMLGQVINDLTLKTDLSQLLESATPFVTRQAAELLSAEAEEIVKLQESTAEDGKYPLDVINAELDEYERRMTRSLTLQALCSQIFEDEESEVLVSGAREREYLLNKQHEFKAVRREVVSGGTFRELISGYEGIKVTLPY